MLCACVCVGQHHCEVVIVRSWKRILDYSPNTLIKYICTVGMCSMCFYLIIVYELNDLYTSCQIQCTIDTKTVAITCWKGDASEVNVLIGSKTKVRHPQLV